jgi:hypothetical protein
MTTNLINVFCCQSIIGIDPIDVILTIGAHLWWWPTGNGMTGEVEPLTIYLINGSIHTQPSRIDIGHFLDLCINPIGHWT